MNPDNFTRRVQKQYRKMLIYTQEWPQKAGAYSLNYVRAHFDMEAYRGNIMIPWKRLKNDKLANRKKLSLSGKLRDSIRLQTHRDSFSIYTRSPYAKVHNEGFKGKVTVRAHQRRSKLRGSIRGSDGKQYSYGAASSIKSRKRVKDKPVYDTQQVEQHTRQMNIPRRQFLPDATRPSNMLIKELKDQLTKDIMKIFN